MWWTFALLLAVFLAGAAVGYGWERLLPPRRDPPDVARWGEPDGPYGGPQTYTDWSIHMDVDDE